MDTDQTRTAETPVLIRALVGMLAVAAFIWSAWATFIAFVGGPLPWPLDGLVLDGSMGTGLLWVFVIDPIVVTVAWWLTLILVIPLVALWELVARPRRPRSRDGGRPLRDGRR